MSLFNTDQTLKYINVLLRTQTNFSQPSESDESSGSPADQPWYVFLKVMMMLFCCYSDPNNTTDDPPEVSQDIGESSSTLLNTPQPPGKKRKVKKLDDVDEAILKSLKNLEEKRARP